MSFYVRFWGVRGSIACPTPRHMRYGGNTSCLEVQAGDHHVILDAGTGIRELGKSFLDRGLRTGTLLLTHTHWDHINGFPFFRPLFDPSCRFRVMAGHLSQNGGVKGALGGQMMRPLFPVPLDALQAKVAYEDFDAGDDFELAPGLRVRTAGLNHPDGATGYRLEHGGKSIVYITDTEHVVGKPDESVLSLMAGADLVIYDSTYTDEEFERYVGWGHSTWQEGVRLAQQAEAKQLAIFHHEQDHEDDFMDQVAEDARRMWPHALVAREGLVIEP
ncbi:MAG TPA: MBL fold metallo-hydrolase [Polyangiaceae bacterium LLY-WYZ-14_1]|jgi:phosphoribosyl 1,2-cyclic phosphodiesterase|nr:MBL fold metallo-hydrolase [Polyangiaceae bacterium LLY-WYZ-14_1]